MPSARSAVTENFKSFISKNLVCMFSINCSRIEQGPCPLRRGALNHWGQMLSVQMITITTFQLAP